MLSIGDGIAAAAMFIAAGGFGIVIVKVRNGKNGKNGSNKFVQKDTCKATHDGLQEQMKMVVEKVVTPINPEEENLAPPVVEQPEGTEIVTPIAEEEKLYAGKYKTPEELEAGYENSNREATRMAQEIKRLTQMVQSALTPTEKKEVEDKVTDLTKHFDGETARVLSSYFNSLVEQRFAKSSQETKEQGDFQTQVSENWEETKKLFPEAANPKSKVYIRANEILFERGLATQNTDGTVQLLTPFAYRIAVEAASLELSRQTSPSANKGKVGAIAGRGSKPATQGKLTYEQYMALPSDEARDAYDKAQAT